MGFGGGKGNGFEDPDDEDADLDHEDDDRDRPPSALPDPLDRLWLHPSELAPLAAAATAPPQARTRPMWATTLVSGAAGAILTLAVLGAVGALGGSSGTTPKRSVVPTSVPIMTARALAVAVAHSVVAVSVRGDSGTRRGSGVCVHRAGDILTSDRLVGSATSVNVTTADGVVHKARVVGRDTTTDLALLSLTSGAASSTTVASDDFGVPAPFATEPPDAGDSVWVVGAPSPGDTALWMSSGVLASIDSRVAAPDGPITSGLLETGAASGSASSGGALVDRTGDVTGIVLSPVDDNRVTYAVPIATALKVAADLRTQGYTAHGALGINGASPPSGATVTAVVTNGPADTAGVRVNDIIESVGNHEVDTMNDLMALIRHYPPGQPVELGLKRGDRTLRVTVTLGSLVTK
jgi:S1-C subfamily serine protease